MKKNKLVPGQMEKIKITKEMVEEIKNNKITIGLI